MSANQLRPSDEERLHELLCDRATQSITPEEHEELERLLAASDLEEDCFDRVAAEIDIALTPEPGEPMPERLRIRITMSAQTLFDDAHRPAARVAKPLSAAPARMPWWTIPPVWPAWVAAAAGLLLAFIAWLPKLAPRATLAEQRNSMLQEASDSKTVAWKATGDPYGPAVNGDVVWSNAKQSGYMRFRDLPRNDPSKYQLQLWIVDKQRDEKFPVDAGVFDVDRETGEVIVPITPKLPIIDPKMFVVTVEKPGGVVVSDRQHIVALAEI